MFSVSTLVVGLGAVFAFGLGQILGTLANTRADIENTS